MADLIDNESGSFPTEAEPVTSGEAAVVAPMRREEDHEPSITLPGGIVIRGSVTYALLAVAALLGGPSAAAYLGQYMGDDAVHITEAEVHEQIEDAIERSMETSAEQRRVEHAELRQALKSDRAEEMAAHEKRVRGEMKALYREVRLDLREALIQGEVREGDGYGDGPEDSPEQ